MTSDTGKANHLCVLIHGLWGNPNHLAFPHSALREAYPDDQLHILASKSNSNSFTYDGIDLGGERVVHEIEDKIRELEAAGHSITKISIAGYSLGGLVARYAIGLLYSNGLFERIQPVNFTTFASPHLGVRTPLLGPHSYVWNILGAHTLSTSGRQLFLIDSFRDTGRPLLSVLADPKSIFIRALASFKHRTLYANCTNDRSAVWYTTSISRTDPYVDMDSVTVNPLLGTDGVLLDPEDPVSPKSLQHLGVLDRIAQSGRNTVKALPFVLFLGVLIPIGSVLFLINSGYQTIRSAQRTRLHEAGQAGIGIERYRMPLLLEEARNLGDRMYRHMGADQGEEYLPTPPPEEDAKATTLTSSSSSSSSGTGSPRKIKGVDKFPTLALTDEQFEMIDNLDAVGWTKYPVNITAVRHTHAAIIVRSDRAGFYQGKVVVGHWVKEFEI